MSAGRPARSRPSARDAAVAAALLALAAGWGLGFWALWRSDLPSGLSLPELDPARFFSAEELGDAARYERFGRVLWLLSEAALLLALVAYARWGGRFARESAAGRVGTGMLLAMLGFAVVWGAQLPFGLLGLWWDRRHGVSEESYLEWALADWLGLGAEFLFVCLAILIVMGIAGFLRDRWWLLGGPVFVGLAALFTYASPYLTPDLRRLDDPAVAADARRLARAQGVGPVPVRVLDVDEFTSAPNAATTGLGPSRRIILWNTLLDGRFERDEIRVVLAHELAHQSRNHLAEGVGWYALFAVPGAYLIARVTRRRGGMADPAAVPLSLLVLVVLQLAARPVENVVSRHLEAEADWVALETTGDPEAARALFENFGRTALQQPSPPTWSYVLLDSHPTLIQRLAMVEGWERRQG